MVDGVTIGYFSPDDAGACDPPATGWVVADGTGPAPTVTPDYPCPTGISIPTGVSIPTGLTTLSFPTVPSIPTGLIPMTAPTGTGLTGTGGLNPSLYYCCFVEYYIGTPGDCSGGLDFSEYTCFSGEELSRAHVNYSGNCFTDLPPINPDSLGYGFDMKITLLAPAITDPVEGDCNTACVPPNVNVAGAGEGLVNGDYTYSAISGEWSNLFAFRLYGVPGNWTIGVGTALYTSTAQWPWTSSGTWVIGSGGGTAPPPSTVTII